MVAFPGAAYLGAARFSESLVSEPVAVIGRWESRLCDAWSIERGAERYAQTVYKRDKTVSLQLECHGGNH